MATTTRRQQLTRLILITTATITAAISLGACLTSGPNDGPITTTVGQPSRCTRLV